MSTRQVYWAVQAGAFFALLILGAALGGCARQQLTEPSREIPSVAQPKADCANFTLAMLERATETSRGSVDYAAVQVTRRGQFQGMVRLSVVESSAPNLFTDWKFDPNPSDGISTWQFTTANDESLRGTRHDVIVRGDDANPTSNSWCTVSHSIFVVDQ